MEFHNTDSSQQKQSILILAFASKPNKGSEEGLGWRHIELASELYESVTVYIRVSESNLADSANYAQLHNIANIKFKPVPEFFFYKLIKPRPLHRRLLPLFYIYFLLASFLLILIRREWLNCDVFMHPTWASDYIVSPVHLLPFKATIVGPLASHRKNFYPFSASYASNVARYRLKQFLRVISVVNWIVAFLPNRCLYAMSSAFLNQTPWRFSSSRKHIISPVPSIFHPANDDSIVSYSDPIEISTSIAQRPNLLFVGKRVDFKNLDLFLETACQIDQNLFSNGVNIIVIGTDVLSYEDLLSKLALTRDAEIRLSHYSSINRLHFIPFMESSRLSTFVQTSLYKPVLVQLSSESGGTVGNDFLSVGIPVICVNGYGISAFHSNFPWSIEPHMTTLTQPSKRDVILHYHQHISRVLSDILPAYQTCRAKAKSLAWTKEAWSAAVTSMFNDLSI